MTGRQRRCGWFDACLVRQTRRCRGINGIALTKLDVLDGFARAQDLRRLQARRRADRQSAGGARGAGPRRADLRDHGGLDAIDARRAQLGRASGAVRQICAPPRGADRVPRWRCSRPARSARTPSWCMIRSRIEAPQASETGPYHRFPLSRPARRARLYSWQ